VSAVAAATVAACSSATSTSSSLAHTSSGGSSSVSSSPTPATLQDFIPIAEKFVEDHRGLKFTSPVQVTFLDDTAFKARLDSKPTAQDQADIEKAAKELRALGLVQGNVDLTKLTQSLLTAAVVGFYDYKTKELVVRGVKPTPYTREVLVHELTHAVQDQHFGLDRPDLSKSNDERSTAFTSVFEGDAVRIEDEYRNSLPVDERAQAQNEASSGQIPTDIPRVLIELLTFPYVAGPPFDTTVVYLRGQQGLDDALRKPPTTTAQLLHPERYFSGDAGQTVAKPPTDGAAFDDGILGEQGLDLLLERAVEAGVLSSNDSRTASAAWAGDHYVAWDRGSVSCLRVSFAGPDQSAATTLATALRRYAATRSGVNVSGLTLTSCA
jgi:hypothetical protein